MTYFVKQNKEPFKPRMLVEFLNTQIASDPLIKDFALSYLYLDSSLDQLTFFGAGLSSLVHIPEEGSLRILHNEHPLLSEETVSEFSETQDNWKVGDTLIYHSLIQDSQQLTMRKTEMERELTQITQEASLLSAQPQAETILKTCKTNSLFATSKETQVVLSIQRIS